MIEKEIYLVSELGLHARPSSLIVGQILKLNLKTAEMHYGTSIASLTSIISLMSLSVRPKTTAIVKLDGVDEQEALEIVEKVFSTVEKAKKLTI
jgi:phosphocarrier protein HPr